ncbi:MAG: hypothetical protein KIT09_16110 [Bryobacteraceae bacterium]|nr:hypothetical protein [Bryobacteraceae bacterium]
MREKTVTVVIDEQGNSSIDLEGFQGSGCADVAKDFQGSDAVRSARNKREFYVQVAAGTRQQQQA